MTHACPACPACSGKRHTPHATVRGVLICRKCEARFTPGDSAIYLGESYSIVHPHWAETSPEIDARARYFDLLTLGSKRYRAPSRMV